MERATRTRCAWAGSNPAYTWYHDKEWGVPLHDDRKFFEMLVLEGAQAGLSWLTILKKRENYRKAFNNFDPVKVSQFDKRKIRTLLSNDGIVRNRLKIEAAIQNARAFLAVQREFGSFDRYIWGFVGGKPELTGLRSFADLPARTPLSDRISEDLKARGFKFVGSTVVYSHMQATGMINDHLVTCFRYNALAKKK